MENLLEDPREDGDREEKIGDWESPFPPPTGMGAGLVNTPKQASVYYARLINTYTRLNKL